MTRGAGVSRARERREMTIEWCGYKSVVLWYSRSAKVRTRDRYSHTVSSICGREVEWDVARVRDAGAELH